MAARDHRFELAGQLLARIETVLSVDEGRKSIAEPMSPSDDVQARFRRLFTFSPVSDACRHVLLHAVTDPLATQARLPHQLLPTLQKASWLACALFAAPDCIGFADFLDACRMQSHEV